MVIDAVKKHREPFAYGLLAVAALYFVAGLSMLFKSSDQLGGAGFATRAAAYGYLFDHPLLIAGLVLAVLFVALGEPTHNARTVVLSAVGLGGLSLLLAIVCWLSGFLADSQFRVLGGVWGGGKAVAGLVGIAGLLMLALATAFAALVLQRLPRPAPVPPGWPGQPQWGQGYGQQQGYGQHAGYGQPPSYGGEPPAGYGEPPGYGQPTGYAGGDYGSPEGYGPPAGPEHQGYGGEQPPSWGQPQSQWAQQGWQPVQPEPQYWPDEQAGAEPQSTGGEPPSYTASWGQPEPPPAEQPEPADQPQVAEQPEPVDPERRDQQQ